MQFQVLGTVCVRDGAEDCTPRGQRARDLLAVLLLSRGRAVSPGLLLDLVWGEEAHTLDVSVVHTQVARLRRAIGPGVVATTPTGYLLEAPPTDADQFLRLLGLARSAGEPDLAVRRLEEARALWRGPSAYADVSEGIASAETSRLADALVGAEEMLVELLLTSARREDALRAQMIAGGLVEREPLREHAHELAMLAAARLDEQAEALLVYDTLRRTLRDELGVDPGRSLQQLHARVLAQDPSLLLPQSSEAAGGATPALPPAPVTRLVGRETELSQVLDAVATRRIVTVTGPGGVGKTRLVLGVAEELMSQRDLRFVDLSTVGETDLERLVHATAQALGESADSLAELGASIGDRSLLVVVDEAERAPSAVAEIVQTVSSQCPGTVFLVTSRTPLGLVGELRITLAPLAVPAPSAAVEEIRAAPAVALLLERLRDHGPDLVLTDADLRLIAELTRRIDGLPLALELVAGYAGTHTLAELAGLLDDALDLATADVGRPARHRSLRQALQWTYERLPPDQQVVLRRLSAFVGHFDLPAVRHVVGPSVRAEEADAAVRSLTRDSLVQVERHGGALRFRLLRTVRDLMAETVESEDDPVALRARHRQWFASPYSPASAPAALAHVSLHHDDHLAALESAIEAGDATCAVALMVRLAAWWEARERDELARRWTTRVLEEVPLDPSQRARVQALRGSLLSHADAEAARADMLAALPQLELDADGDALVLTHAAVALEMTTSAMHEQALEHAVAAVAAARRWAPSRLAVALAIEGAVAVETRTDLASAAVAEAYDLLLSTDVGDDAAPVAANVGWTLFALGRPADGLRVIERGVASLPTGAVPTYLTIHHAWALLLGGEAARALSGFVRALEGETTCETRWHADVFTGAGCALAQLGRAEARAVLDGAAALVERTGHALAGWQVELVRRTREDLSGAPGSWITTRDGSGALLAAMVREAAV